MLLTITTTHQPANDLGYLLHKHPERFQSFDMSFGKVHVYYSEVSAERCSACLLLDVDAVGMVRGKNAMVCRINWRTTKPRKPTGRSRNSWCLPSRQTRTCLNAS